MVEGKSAFAKMGVPGCRAFAGNGAPGIFRRQSPGLYRLVCYGWVLPVILRVAIIRQRIIIMHDDVMI